MSNLDFSKILIPVPYNVATILEYDELSIFGQSSFEKALSDLRKSYIFRRLSNITQVVLESLNHNNFYHAIMRQGHSEEVSSTAGKIARLLKLPFPYLARLVGLAHDCGHAPCGHAGEAILEDILSKHGYTFEHNAQALKAIIKFSKNNKTCRVRNDKNSKGLNLPRQALIDLSVRAKRKNPKHGLIEYIEGEMSLEGWTIYFADKLVYVLHDLEDLLSLGIITVSELRQNEFLNEIYKKTDMNDDNILHLSTQMSILIYNYFVENLFNNCLELMKYISEINKSSNIVFTSKENLITLEPAVQKEFNELLGWMYKNIYHEKFQTRDERSKRTIKLLYEALYEDKNLRNLFNKACYDQEEPLCVFVADLIAMSDEKFIKEFIIGHTLA